MNHQHCFNSLARASDLDYEQKFQSQGVDELHEKDRVLAFLK